MRVAPLWFQQELTRIGGTNPYGESIFRFVWAPTETIVIGGAWRTGFEGYKEVRAIHGVPCWALMVWEPRQVQGSPEMWEIDYMDESGYLQCGGYPKYGRYRLLKRFHHQEIVTKSEHRLQMYGRRLIPVEVRKPELAVYRMEPCGLMLDLMLPMLMRWRRLSNAARVAALKQEEQLEKDEFCRKAKDALDGTRIRRGSQLVASRAEVIEKGFTEAMAVAARTGLGMRIGD